MATCHGMPLSLRFAKGIRDWRIGSHDRGPNGIGHGSRQAPRPNALKLYYKTVPPTTTHGLLGDNDAGIRLEENPRLLAAAISTVGFG